MYLVHLTRILHSREVEEEEEWPHVNWQGLIEKSWTVSVLEKVLEECCHPESLLHFCRTFIALHVEPYLTVGEDRGFERGKGVTGKINAEKSLPGNKKKDSGRRVMVRGTHYFERNSGDHHNK